jgi:hypothetical protein
MDCKLKDQLVGVDKEKVCEFRMNHESKYRIEFDKTQVITENARKVFITESLRLTDSSLITK